MSQDIQDNGGVPSGPGLLGWTFGMSKARLVITAVTIEKRPVSEVARSYGVARSWIYTLLARY